MLALSPFIPNKKGLILLKPYNNLMAEERGFEPLRHHWPTRFRDEPLQPDLGILPFKKSLFHQGNKLTII